MRLRKLPVLAAICFLGLLHSSGGARTVVSSSGVSSVDKDGLGTHRQYSHSLENGGSVSYGGKPVASVSSVSSSGGAYGGSGELSASGTRNTGVFESSKGFSSQSSGGSSVEYGGNAEGSFHSLFPAAPSGGYPSQSGGYPSQSSPTVASTNQGQHPPIDGSQPHGPAYTYYYQHYPTSASGAWNAPEGHEEGGQGGFLGDIGSFGTGGGAGGFGALAGLKGLGIIAAIAKGVLAIKPFLILGLLLLIAVPVLLLFLPIPIITVTGTTKMSRAAKSKDPSVISYLTDLSQRVLTSEECLERFLCKLPKAPEAYQKKAKSIWETYGESFIKSERVSRGVEAYFNTSKEKNRVFKCNQRFQCSNKFI